MEFFMFVTVYELFFPCSFLCCLDECIRLSLRNQPQSFPVVDEVEVGGENFSVDCLHKSFGRNSPVLMTWEMSWWRWGLFRVQGNPPPWTGWIGSGLTLTLCWLYWFPFLTFRNSENFPFLCCLDEWIRLRLRNESFPNVDEVEKSWENFWVDCLQNDAWLSQFR